MKLCRHCKVKRASRPKGLCWGCWTRHRDRYPSESKFGNRGVPDFSGAGRTPDPTDATPGTPEKVAVLMERCRSRQDLWHPEDAAAGSLYRAAANEPDPDPRPEE